MTRLATVADRRYILTAIRNKKIAYIRPIEITQDIENQRLWLLIKDNKPAAMCSLVPEPEHNYTAVKRVTTFRKTEYGKGLAVEMIRELTAGPNTTFGATPWADNEGMRKVFEKCGFEYQYTFKEIWTCYKKLSKRG